MVVVEVLLLAAAAAAPAAKVVPRAAPRAATVATVVVASLAVGEGARSWTAVLLPLMSSVAAARRWRQRCDDNDVVIMGAAGSSARGEIRGL